MMSIVWTYIENKAEEQYYCIHCNNLTESPFFHSDFTVEGESLDALSEIGDGHIICIRCAKVLMKLMSKLGIAKEVLDGTAPERHKGW
jgi:hypothetical protein